jgi:hypothetical protein
MGFNGGGIYRVTSRGNSTKTADVVSGSTVAFGRGLNDMETLYYATSGGAVMAVEGMIE